MTPRLYGHPFSNYTWKALIAFYEAGLDFEFRSMEEPGAGEALQALWPMAKFPLLEADDGVWMEATVIAEWVDQRRSNGARLIPASRELALQTRMLDRVFDNYVTAAVQTIVGDRLRPEGERDAYGVNRALERLGGIYPWLDARLAGREWIAGDAFSLADAAGACSLFYADWIRPVAEHAELAAYLRRLRARPSVARCVDEARPYRAYFPLGVPAHAD